MAKKRNRRNVPICLQEDYDDDFFIGKVLNRLKFEEREDFPLCLRYFVFGIMVEYDGFLKIEVYPKPASGNEIGSSEKPIFSIRFDDAPGMLAHKDALIPVRRIIEFDDRIVHKITEEFLAKNGTLTFGSESEKFYVNIQAGGYRSEVSLTEDELGLLCLKPSA